MHFGISEDGGICGEDYIACGGETRAACDCISLHCRDDGLVIASHVDEEISDRHRVFEVSERAGSCCNALELCEVSACTEILTGRGQEYDLNGLVFLRVAQRILKRSDRLRIECVSFLGSIESDARYAAL